VEYNGSWWVKVGKIIFAHPLTYSSGMLKTTEKAVNYVFVLFVVQTIKRIVGFSRFMGTLKNLKYYTRNRHHHKT